MKMLEDLAEVVRLFNEADSMDYGPGRADAWQCAKSAADDYLRTHHATIRDMAARLEAANALLLESDRYVFGNNHDLSVRIADHFNQAMQETGR